MFIWKGYGFLVAVITVISCAMFTMLFKSFNGYESLGEGVGATFAGPIIWIIGKSLNDPKKYRYMIDQRTGREIIVSSNHSMFFIKMQYWAFIIGGLGILYCLKILFRK
jgi:hypothetical protein